MQRATVTVHLKRHKTWSFTVYGMTAQEVNHQIQTFRQQYKYDFLDIGFEQLDMMAITFEQKRKRAQTRFNDSVISFGKRNFEYKCKPLDMAAVNRFLRIS